MLVCPKCGRENADDARFCSACGTSLEAQEGARKDAFASALKAGRGGRPWIEAGLAYVSGEFSDAADRYAVIGALPMEADARVRAAQALMADGRRAEADREVERALAFWHSVGATAYVREGEALLAAAG